MKAHTLWLAALLLLVAACATPPQDRRPQRLAEDGAKGAQAAPAPTLADLPRWVAQGESGEGMIARLKSANAHFELSPSQVLELHRQGVPVVVLDYLYQHGNSVRQTDRAAELNGRDAACRQALEVQARQMRSNPAHCPWPPGYYDPWWPHRTHYWWH